MKILLTIVAVQSGNVRAVQSDGMDLNSRAKTAAGGVQAQIEEADVEKLGPGGLVFARQGLERLEIRADQVNETTNKERLL